MVCVCCRAVCPTPIKLGTGGRRWNSRAAHSRSRKCGVDEIGPCGGSARGCTEVVRAKEYRGLPRCLRSRMRCSGLKHLSRAVTVFQSSTKRVGLEKPICFNRLSAPRWGGCRVVKDVSAGSAAAGRCGLPGVAVWLGGYGGRGASTRKVRRGGRVDMAVRRCGLPDAAWQVRRRDLTEDRRSCRASRRPTGADPGRALSFCANTRQKGLKRNTRRDWRRTFVTGE